MNKDVYNSILQAILRWTSGKKKFTFETRSSSFPSQNYVLNGELLFQFYIKVDGFFNKNSNSELIPIKLEYFSEVFTSTILNEENPENVNADGYRLEEFLNRFTKETYVKVEKDLKEKESKWTSDPLYME